jgi:hypothetical protein
MSKLKVRILIAGLAVGLAIPAFALAQSPDQGDGDDSHTTWSYQVKAGEATPLLMAAEDGQFGFLQLLGKGYIGIGLTDLSPQLRAHFAESEDAGVMVNEVVAGSPADAAGLRVGDVITAIDGDPVATSRQLSQRVRGRDPEDRVTVELFREGRRQLVEVTIGERERTTVDLGDHLRWEVKEGDEPFALHFDASTFEGLADKMPKELYFGDLTKQLEGIDWQGIVELQKGNPELEQRMKALEERIEKLVQELHGKVGDDGQ